MSTLLHVSISEMRKKIYRVTPDDENDLMLLVQFVQDFYVTERAKNATLTATIMPNEASVIRAMIRALHPVAASCVASQRAEIRREVAVPMPEMDARALMLRLFEDGHLTAD